MVRELDLKKPPSIAESIDWARALLLLGADDIDADVFRDDDVDHRQAPHRPRHRGRAGRRAARRRRDVSLPAAGRRASRRRCAPRASRSGPPSCIDAFARPRRGRWTERVGVPRGARRHARQVARGPARLRPRVRALLLPRRRGGRDGAGRARGARRAGGEDEDGITGGEQIDYDNLREQLLAGDPRRRRVRHARPRAARDRRLRPPRRGLGRARRRRPAHPPRARAALGARRAGPGADGARPSRRSRATRSAASSSSCAASSSARRSSARSRCRPSRPLNELDRALPSGPLQDLAAVHRVVTQLKRRLATQGHEARGRQPPRARRRAPHDARVAADRRRAGRAQVPPAAPAPPGALRAVRRLHLGHQRVGVLPVACCTRCTTRSARCARSCSSSGSPRSPTSSSASARSRPSPTRSPRTRAWPTCPATPTTAACGASSSRSVDDDLHPRATVIVLGDARTNGRDPRADVFARIAARAGRTFWLNPEPRLYWNYGDSVICRLRAATARPTSAGRRASSRTS